VSENPPEESMSAPEIPEMPEEALTPVGNTAFRSGGIGNRLAQMIDENASRIVHIPTCLICSNPNRNDIEDKWAESKDFKIVKEYIKSKSSLDVSESIVENHMIYHLSRGVKEQVKIEYADKIKRLVNCPLSTLDMIDVATAALHERLMGINSITPGGDLGVAEIEKIKTTETARITSSLSSLLKLQASIRGEMTTSGELLSIPTNNFVDIFNEAIAEAKTERERELVNDVLEKLEAIARAS